MTLQNAICMLLNSSWHVIKFDNEPFDWTQFGHGKLNYTCKVSETIGYNEQQCMQKKNIKN